MSNQRLTWFSLCLAVGFCGLLFLRWKALNKNLSDSLKSELLTAASLPRERGGEFATSNACRSCHPEQYASWHDSYHRTMTQPVNAATVLGEFDGTSIASDGLNYRVFQRNGEYWAEMPDPEELMYVVQGGKPLPVEEISRVERRVVMSTGSHHYQTYWVSGDKKYGNLLQTLPLVYLRDDMRWIPREAAFMRPRESPRMVTQWNHHCIRCHSTGGNPGLVGDGAGSGFDTQVAELGISCEACHGSGKAHIEHYTNPVNRYSSYAREESIATIVNPESLDHARASEVCGQCHGVYVMRDEYGMQYARNGSLYRPGDDLSKTRYYIQYPSDTSDATRQAELAKNPRFFQERWWKDGTILAGGREYTALLASACFTEGELSCLTCHTMHHGDPQGQLITDMDSNQACISCHTETRFTKDLKSHTHHDPAGEGSNCLNCHMPHTTYALFRAIRSHQISIPQAEASIVHGTPNACNCCHLNQTLAWTRDHLRAWYGQPSPEPSGDMATVAAGALWMLKGNAAQRAIAAWHAGWPPAQRVSGTQWLPPHLAVMLADPYGVVRYIGHQSLRTYPGFEDFEFDFVGSDKALADAAARAVALWNSFPPKPAINSSELLQDEQGHLLAEEVRRLLRERDHQPIYIKE